MSMQQTSIGDGAAMKEEKYQILNNNNNNNEADGNRSERVFRTTLIQYSIRNMLLQAMCEESSDRINCMPSYT